jgi:hypothetical protein
MFFAIDIDFTIAGGYPGRFFNEVLELGYTEKELNEIPFDQFFTHPVFKSIPEAELAEHWERAMEHLPSMATRPPYPDAIEKVNWLFTLGNIHYVTVRGMHHRSGTLRDEIMRTTFAWLEDHGFPVPEQIYYCHSLQEKILFVAQAMQQAPNDRVFLIDDKCDEIVQAFLELEKEVSYQALLQQLRQHLTLIAFQRPLQLKPKEYQGFHILPISSWDMVDSTLLSLYPSPQKIKA